MLPLENDEDEFGQFGALTLLSFAVNKNCSYSKLVGNWVGLTAEVGRPVAFLSAIPDESPSLDWRY